MTPHPALALAATILLGGCGTTEGPTKPAETLDLTDTVQVSLDPPPTPPPTPSTVRTIAPAVATATAEPVVERTTTEPPDPCGPEAHAYVNGLAYQPDNKQPTTEAYLAVTTCAGWTPATQDFYRAGIIDDIFPGESRQCPAVVGLQGVKPDCTPIGPGNGEDSGFFQITSAGWGRNSLLCKAGLYCSSRSIIATPWDSMNAGIQLIMRSKPTNFPWNWNSWSRRYHPTLGHWPDEWSNLP